MREILDGIACAVGAVKQQMLDTGRRHQFPEHGASALHLGGEKRG